MKILVIDANRSGLGPTIDRPGGPPSMANPKWRVVAAVAQALEADLVWRSGVVKQDPISGYDALVFSRALPTVAQNMLWLKANPTATVFHLTNDYLVRCGELYVAAHLLHREVHTVANYPLSLARYCKTGASFTLLNLNALLYESDRWRPASTPQGTGCVYYGACRPERADLFRKYFTGHVTVAQYKHVCRQFEAYGVPGPWAHRIGWRTRGLYPWAASFYVQNREQDVVPFFSNRFYEALSYEVRPIFAGESRATIGQTEYDIPESLIVDSPDAIPAAIEYSSTHAITDWRRQAAAEYQRVLGDLRRHIRGH